MSEDKNEEKKKEEASKNESNGADKGKEQEQKSETVQKKDYDEMKERASRLAAEFDNYKKRSSLEIENAKNVGKVEILKRIIPVLDEFELAMMSSNFSKDENLSKGIKMVYANLMDSLIAEGLTEINTKGKYDPYNIEIMMAQETEKAEPGTILEVLKKGYRLKGMLIRPASVIIAKGPENKQENKGKPEGILEQNEEKEDKDPKDENKDKK